MAHSAITAPDPAAGPLAEKIYRLVIARWPDKEKRPGVARIAEEIGERTGRSISPTYLHELLRGKKRDIGIERLEALARFFGVKPQYFFDAEYAETVDAQLRLAQALRDSNVRGLVARAQGLSPEGLEAAVAAIQHIRRVEKLPEVDDV
jgi:transcriptional regulator with XRE-family HTH domain